MKKLVFLFSIVVSLGVQAQKTVPTSAPKPKTLAEVLKNSHTLVSAKRDLKYGWDVSLKLSSRVKDDSLSLFEVMRADSTFYCASIMFPEYETLEKGQTLKRFIEIMGDSIAPTDRFAPIGTFKDFYPNDSIAEGKASIMFLDAIIPDSPLPGYFLPDFEVTNGAFHVGDTIEMVDQLGRTCTAKIEVLEINYEGIGSRYVTPVSFAIPAFTVSESFNVFMIYSKLSGVDMGEKITIRKMH